MGVTEVAMVVRAAGEETAGLLSTWALVAWTSLGIVVMLEEAAGLSTWALVAWDALETAAALEETELSEPQVPKAALQPVPQWSVVDPHQPACEQQLPNAEPLHPRPLAAPHVPSVDTPVGVAEGAAAGEVADEAAEEELTAAATALEEKESEEPQTPKVVWQPVPQ